MTLPSAAELEHAASCVEHEPRARALSLFVSQMMTSWADARALVYDPQQVGEHAVLAGVDRAGAETELGNLLQLLARGPRTGLEFAVLSAFGACGFAITVAAAAASGGAELEAVTDRLVSRVEWLEAATDFRVSGYLLRGLSGPPQQGMLDALQRAVLREDLAELGPDITARARNVLRMTALASARDEPAKSVLRTLRRSAHDPATRAFAVVLLDEIAQAERAAGAILRIAGVARPPSHSVPLALLRWLSGWALLQALQRALYFVLALRRESEIELRGEALHVRARTQFFGLTLQSSEAHYEVERVTGAFRYERFSRLRRAAGATCLTLGVVLGGYMVFDGARGGAPLLLVLGALIVALACGLEWMLNVVLPARAARVDVQVDVRGAGSLRLGRVVQTDADRLLEALSLRLSR
jgi:hypothetical protein